MTTIDDPNASLDDTYLLPRGYREPSSFEGPALTYNPDFHDDSGCMCVHCRQGAPLPKHYPRFVDEEIALAIGRGKNAKAPTPEHREDARNLVDAAEHNNLAKIKELLPPSIEKTCRMRAAEWLLVPAARRGATEVLKYLLEQFPSINLEHQEVYMHGTALIQAANHGFANIVNLLIGHGARVDAYDKVGQTALLLAVRQGHLPVVVALLNNSANPNHTFGAKNHSPLIVAGKFGYQEIVQALLKHGANPLYQDGDGWRARDHADYNHRSEVSQLLHNAEKQTRPGRGDAPAPGTPTLPTHTPSGASCPQGRASGSTASAEPSSNGAANPGEGSKGGNMVQEQAAGSGEDTEGEEELTIKVKTRVPVAPTSKSKEELEAEEEARKAEREKKRLKKERQKARKKEEEAKAEAARKEAEAKAEAERKQAEEAKVRKAAEEEAAREAARKASEEERAAARKAAEEEKARKAAEEEATRKAEEEQKAAVTEARTTLDALVETARTVCEEAQQTECVAQLQEAIGVALPLGVSVKLAKKWVKKLQETVELQQTLTSLVQESKQAPLSTTRLAEVLLVMEDVRKARVAPVLLQEGEALLADLQRRSTEQAAAASQAAAAQETAAAAAQQQQAAQAATVPRMPPAYRPSAGGLGTMRPPAYNPAAARGRRTSPLAALATGEGLLRGQSAASVADTVRTTNTLATLGAYGCPICMERMVTLKITKREGACGHCFCETCWDGWVIKCQGKELHCPMCRAPISMAEVDRKFVPPSF